MAPEVTREPRRRDDYRVIQGFQFDMSGATSGFHPLDESVDALTSRQLQGRHVGRGLDGYLGPDTYGASHLEGLPPNHTGEVNSLPSLSSWFPDNITMIAPLSARLEVAARNAQAMVKNDGLSLHSLHGLRDAFGSPVAVDDDGRHRVMELVADNIASQSSSDVPFESARVAGSRKTVDELRYPTSGPSDTQSPDSSGGPAGSSTNATSGDESIFIPPKVDPPYANPRRLPVVSTSHLMHVRWLNIMLEGREVEIYPYRLHPNVVTKNGKPFVTASTRNALVWGPLDHASTVMPPGDVWIQSTLPGKVSISLGEGDWVEWLGNERTDEYSHPLLPDRRLWFAYDAEFSWVKKAGLPWRRSSWSGMIRETEANLRASAHTNARGHPRQATVKDVVSIMSKNTIKLTQSGSTAVACVPCHAEKAKCFRYSNGDNVPCDRCRIRKSVCFYPDMVERSRRKSRAVTVTPVWKFQMYNGPDNTRQ
ncbi:hypothetical protein BV25DRAFT_1913067 [Artomyces pyxidatus]|uniref:Uncharacterized protein n=1 Tax=Artomyces pyxidatus TaxID=48021 RepID=A0ACB8TBM2_9AGAM|nr:hypothetical protein BV25DRAFT_1913067 [Artomyces pyxidatus]